MKRFMSILCGLFFCGALLAPESSDQQPENRSFFDKVSSWLKPPTEPREGAKSPAIPSRDALDATSRSAAEEPRSSEDESSLATSVPRDSIHISGDNDFLNRSLSESPEVSKPLTKEQLRSQVNKFQNNILENKEILSHVNAMDGVTKNILKNWDDLLAKKQLQAELNKINQAQDAIEKIVREQYQNIAIQIPDVYQTDADQEESLNVHERMRTQVDAVYNHFRDQVVRLVGKFQNKCSRFQAMIAVEDRAILGVVNLTLVDLTTFHADSKQTPQQQVEALIKNQNLTVPAHHQTKTAFLDGLKKLLQEHQSQEALNPIILVARTRQK